MTEPKIANGAVTAAKIAADAVTSAAIATDAVQATEIADDSIDGGEIVDNSLGAADLAPDSVGNSELQNDAVTSANVLANSLTTADIAGTSINGAVSFSGVPNGRCSQVTLGVSGAQPGEVPIISTKAALQNGIVLYAQRVSSVGHVEADICNFSGTTMTAINDLPVRVITIN